jgi:hypothetical protein
VVIVHLNDGRTMVEIGEHVLHLVRPEAARLEQGLAGVALEHTTLARVTELQDQLRAEIAKRCTIEREVLALKKLNRMGNLQIDFI